MKGVCIWLEEGVLDFVEEIRSKSCREHERELVISQRSESLEHTRLVGGGVYAFLGLPPVSGVLYGPDLL